MGGKKMIVYTTAVIFITLFSFVSTSIESKVIATQQIVPVPSFPILGNPDAKVEILLIEDFKCKHCRSFSEQFFPKLISKYLESGKVRFTLVPLAFLKGSKPLANAALAVYDLSPDRFLPFILELIHRVQMAKKEYSVENLLIETAQKVGGIQLQKLRECIKTRCHENELEINYEWAKQLMGEDFGTPSLYLNGHYVNPSMYPTIWNRIDEAIQEANQR